jgi:hypothetical protein
LHKKADCDDFFLDVSTQARPISLDDYKTTTEHLKCHEKKIKNFKKLDFILLSEKHVNFTQNKFIAIKFNQNLEFSENF